jgi:creatinine amidohydrolase
MDDQHQWRYDRLSWPQMKAAISRKPQPVVAIPFGAVEDHGPHLPLSTDNDILEAILKEAAQRSQGELLVLPTIPFGLDEHHMDFPGTISIQMETCLAYVAQTAISVARHGFTHILIVNGHGSNHPITDLAARKCVLETGMICANTTINAAIDPTLAAEVIEKYRQGGPGSISHAGEFETAIMLHILPEFVQMDKAQRELGQIKLKYFNWDHPEPSVFGWQDFWSRMSVTGICGDAAVATAEFGKLTFVATVTHFLEMVLEFRTIPLRERVDHH